MNINTLGIYLAKNVFQLHGVDERGQVALRKRVGRAKLFPLSPKLLDDHKRRETCKLSQFAIAFAFLIPAWLIGVANADTRCRTDSFGYTNCSDSSGNRWRGRTDSFGNVTWSDNRGNTIRGRTDSFGNTIYRDNLGGTLRRRTDSFGNETWRDNSGYSIKGRTDYFGNRTYQDNFGNTVKCRADSSGNTTCR